MNPKIGRGELERLARRFSAAAVIALLPACAFTAAEKTALPGAEQQAAAENCALAEERQNRLAIDHWCREPAREK